MRYFGKNMAKNRRKFVKIFGSHENTINIHYIKILDHLNNFWAKYSRLNPFLPPFGLYIYGIVSRCGRQIQRYRDGQRRIETILRYVQRRKGKEGKEGNPLRDEQKSPLERQKSPRKKSHVLAAGGQRWSPKELNKIINIGN